MLMSEIGVWFRTVFNGNGDSSRIVYALVACVCLLLCRRIVLAKNGRDLNRAVLAAESLVEEVKAGIQKILVIPCLMTIFRRYLKNGKLEIRMQMQCISP